MERCNSSALIERHQSVDALVASGAVKASPKYQLYWPNVKVSILWWCSINSELWQSAVWTRPKQSRLDFTCTEHTSARAIFNLTFTLHFQRKRLKWISFDFDSSRTRVMLCAKKKKSISKLAMSICYRNSQHFEWGCLGHSNCHWNVFDRRRCSYPTPSFWALSFAPGPSPESPPSSTPFLDSQPTGIQKYITPVT